MGASTRQMLLSVDALRYRPKLSRVIMDLWHTAGLIVYDPDYGKTSYYLLGQVN